MATFAANTLSSRIDPYGQDEIKNFYVQFHMGMQSPRCISQWAKLGQKRWTCFSSTGRTSIKPLAILAGAFVLAQLPVILRRLRRALTYRRAERSLRRFLLFLCYSVSPLTIR